LEEQQHAFLQDSAVVVFLSCVIIERRKKIVVSKNFQFLLSIDSYHATKLGIIKHVCGCTLKDT
jgi:hypothetical protein